MKTVVYVAGGFVSGKTTACKEFAKLNGFTHYETDKVYDPMIAEHNRPIMYPGYRTEEDRQELRKKYAEKFYDCHDRSIVEGFAVNFKEDREMIKAVIGPHRAIHIYIQPKYDHWLLYHEKRMRETGLPDINKNWNFYSSTISLFEPPEKCWYLGDPQELIVPVGRYQTSASEHKIKAILQDCILTGATVLDLGCAEGLAGEYMIKEKKAAEVVGLDNNWWALSENRSYGNLARLCDLEKERLLNHGRFDIALCLSLLHRIMDKERFVREISSAADNAIFELPVSNNSGFKITRYDKIPGHNPAETQAWCPSEEYIKYLLNKYFSRVQLMGRSPIKYGDESNRLVWICKK